MKIVVLDGYVVNPGDLSWAPIEALGEFKLYDRSAPDEVDARIEGAEVVLTNKVTFDRARLERAKALKYLGIFATGYNIVDTQAARELGITVTNIPAYSTDSVVQMVFAHLLEICINVGRFNAQVHRGRWSENPDFYAQEGRLIELAGKTMGIIGYGRIGRRVGQTARSLGMNVIAWTRTPRDPECVSLDELLAKSDVISLHCPLNEETRNLINRETIAKMKDGAILINTSRGPVVNEADLAEALRSGKLYAAAADVTSVEPLPADSPLMSAPNMQFTPHIGWATFEARQRLMRISVENLRAYLAGAPINVVS